MRFAADRPLGLAPATINDYRELARRRLPRQLFDYIDGGAYEEATMRANVADLEDVLLRQVVMRDVSERVQKTEVLGQAMNMPVILAPVGLGGMFAPRAEVQAARAAERAGIPFIESTVSICSIEEVANATSTPPWFQLYVMRDRGYAEDLMARAQAVGSPVLCLTIDLAVVGARHRDVRNAIGGQPGTWAKVRRGLDLALHPGWIRSTALGGRPLTFGNLEKAVPGARSPDAFKEWVDAQFDPSVTWDDVAWVRENWNGRLVVKGVLDAEDARRAVDAGVDGIVVSKPRRPPARLRPLDGTRAAGGCRGGRRPGRGPGRRRRAHWPGRCQDDCARCPRRADRARVGVGCCGAWRGRGAPRPRRHEGRHRHGAGADGPDVDRRRRRVRALQPPRIREE
jgi:L-lactate dehydrogenase (cytochrome)